MPAWLFDTAVITTIISTSYGFVTFIIKRKDAKKQVQFEDIASSLNEMKRQLQDVYDKTESIQDGTKKIQRYRLFNDLKHELAQGYTTLEKYRELGILFESYTELGGNGEIEVLYEKYKELPIKEV